MNESQKQFEAWASRYHGLGRMGSINGHYSNENVSHDWDVWQLSRKDIVVELPAQWVAPYEEREVMTAIYVKEALDEAGVSYK